MRILFSALLLSGSAAFAGDAVVVDATARAVTDGWRVDVTISHGDTGWDHYADGWRVELEDGTELGFRLLLHPHVTEQPFTRSLSPVAIPEDVEVIYIRPRDLVHGWSETRFALQIR